MKQYHDLLKTILDKGSYKEPAREGMPGTTSLFGYQMRFDLQKGFPILTTKKINFHNIVVELLWFLKGDTNIKYLIDNDCNIWNEDAYNFYIKSWGEGEGATRTYWTQQNINPPNALSFEDFIRIIKEQPEKIDIQGNSFYGNHGPYRLGDCGFQYGKVWRDWTGIKEPYSLSKNRGNEIIHIDQLSKVISNIKIKPYDRRKLITAVDPLNDTDLALYWCHSLFQFNCRKATQFERAKLFVEAQEAIDINERDEILDKLNAPKYFLDCHMYQRSADVFLGVPYNISSYALLTHIIARICNMVPGEYIHSFGDVHIYDNHRDQVTEILTRDVDKYRLPTLHFENPSYRHETEFIDLDMFLDEIAPEYFELHNYQSYPSIKAKLSTGLK